MIKYLFSSYPMDREQNLESQHMTLNTVALTSAIMVFIFAIVNAINNHYNLALLEVVVVFIYAACFLRVKIALKKKLVMTASILILLGLFADGGIAKVAIFWSLLIPFLACLFIGLPRAWYWILGYAVMMIVTLLLHEFWQPFLPYSDKLLTYFLLMYIQFSFLAALFQSQFERSNGQLRVSVVKLQDLQDNLEEKVNQRTEALEKTNEHLKNEINKHDETARALQDSEVQLYQMQKMEAIDTLVGGIAHDFNNMLAGINANMFMIKQKVVDEPDLLRRTKDVEKLVMNASNMVRQLLTFARKDHVDFESFDMALFLKEAYKLSEVAVSEHIMMQFDNYKGNLPILGNKTQIQQVLMNIINNARDAVTKIKKPSILITLNKQEAKKPIDIQGFSLPVGAYAVLSIRDNGEGIPADKLKNIFEPFYTTKEVGKGTGLGLAMCFGAVQSHGGVIRVRSKVGSGTIFEVFIPVVENVEMKPITQEVKRERLASGETILLVDDDDVLRESQTDALESIGYQVITAKNGKEAIAVYKQEKDNIDLIVTDMTMPVMGGVRAAKEIRKIDPDAKIMFITGYDRDSTFNGEGLPNVGEVVLEKPYTMFQLHDAIQKKLQASN